EARARPARHLSLLPRDLGRRRLRQRDVARAPRHPDDRRDLRGQCGGGFRERRLRPPEVFRLIGARSADHHGSRPIATDKVDLYRIEEGMWYGWPDFAGGVPVTDAVPRPSRRPPGTAHRSRAPCGDAVLPRCWRIVRDGAEPGTAGALQAVSAVPPRAAETVGAPAEPRSRALSRAAIDDSSPGADRN